MPKIEKIIGKKIIDSSSIREGIHSFWRQEIPLQRGYFTDEELEYLLEDTRLLKEELCKVITVVEGNIPTVMISPRDGELFLTIGGNISRWKWR